MNPSPFSSAAPTSGKISELALDGATMSTEWHPYLFASQPNFGILSAADNLRLDGNDLARCLLKAEDGLRSLLVMPLLGTCAGLGGGNSLIHGGIVEDIYKVPILMEVPEIANFVNAALREMRNSGEKYPAFTNSNAREFMLLRQRLEDRLVDLKVTPRMYNVRPAYDYSSEAYPSLSRFSHGDILTFTVSKTSHLRCKAIAGVNMHEAQHCPVYEVQVSDSTHPDVLGAKRAYIGRFDFKKPSLEPTTEFGKCVLESAFQYVKEKDHAHQAAYFIAFVPHDAEGVGIKDTRLLYFSPTTINIFPSEPSELAVLQLIKRREGELARYFDGQPGFKISEAEPRRVIIASGYVETLPTKLIRSPQEPFLQMLTKASNGTVNAKVLDVQDWLRELERC